LVVDRVFVVCLAAFDVFAVVLVDAAVDVDVTEPAVPGTVVSGVAVTSDDPATVVSVVGAEVDDAFLVPPPQAVATRPAVRRLARRAAFLRLWNPLCPRRSIPVTGSPFRSLRARPLWPGFDWERRAVKP
jgi:hypothetical protein